jgi:predicted nucleic acid-binding protein
VSLVLDAGAIRAIAEGDPRARHILRFAHARGEPVLTPTVVVAEVTTGEGPRDARTNRVLSNLQLIPVSEKMARRAGALRFRARRPETVDALVVATAEATLGGIVLTGDAKDLEALAGVSKGVEVQTFRR